MAEVAPSAPASSTSTQPVAEPPGGSPLRLGLAIAAGLGLAFLGFELSLGRIASLARDGPHPRGDFRIAWILIALTAYLPAAFASTVRSARRTVAELAPVLRAAPAEVDAFAADAGRFDPVALRRAGLVGLVAAAALPLATNLELATWFVWRLPPESVVHRLLLPPMGWFAGRFVYAVLTESARLSRLARERVAVDLLDPAALRPIARQGLRHALLLIGLVSIVAFALYDRNVAPALPVVLAALLGITLVTSAVALLLPARGARDAVLAAKRAELARVREELRAVRDGADATGRRSLADLLAWRACVESVPDWPFDAPTLLRYAAYLALPLGSWLGGALVERLVDALV